MLSFFVMNFLISSSVLAEEVGETINSPSPIMGFLPLILVFVIFYFFAIRPQQKKAKEHKKLLESVAKGDKILTSGGIIGIVAKVDSKTDSSPAFVYIEVAPKVEIKVILSAISDIMNKSKKREEPRKKEVDDSRKKDVEEEVPSPDRDKQDI